MVTYAKKENNDEPYLFTHVFFMFFSIAIVIFHTPSFFCPSSHSSHINFCPSVVDGVLWNDRSMAHPQVFMDSKNDFNASGWNSRIGNAWNMGVSENSVPLNPMVNDHYPY